MLKVILTAMKKAIDYISKEKVASIRKSEYHNSDNSNNNDNYSVYTTYIFIATSLWITIFLM